MPVGAVCARARARVCVGVGGWCRCACVCEYVPEFLILCERSASVFLWHVYNMFLPYV